MFKELSLMLLISGFFTPYGLAQNQAKNEVALLLGASVTPSLQISNPSEQITFATGLTFQATYARHLAGGRAAAVYFELPFAASPNVGVFSANSSVPANYASLFVTPGVRIKLRSNAGIAPWFSVGGGFARFHESAELQNANPNLGRIGANRGTVQFGAGVDLRTPIKVLLPIGLRVEIRDLYSGKPNYGVPVRSSLQHNLLFSGGIVTLF